MHSALACRGKKLVNADNGNIGKMIKEKNTVIWVDIENPNEKDKKLLSETFGFHPLAIDDCAHFTHIPKVDDFGKYIFIVFHKILFDKKTKTFKLVELDIFLGKNYIVTVHGGTSPEIDTVKKKIMESCAPLSLGPPLVLHALLEYNTFQYFPLLEHLDKSIEELEEKILSGKTKNAMREITKLKKQVYSLKRSFLPQRDVINGFQEENLWLFLNRQTYTSGTYMTT